MGRVLVHPIATSYNGAIAVLHDVREDCGVTYDQLKDLFGSVIAEGVSDLTNVSKIEHPNWNRKQRKKYDIDRLRCTRKEIQIIRLIDRIDNLRDMFCADDFIKVYCAESLQLLEAIGRADPDLAKEAEILIEHLTASIS
jgi:(p)ppGpp synthase/HD superfamily hydrolase